jgi:hypothetical protein
MDGRLTIHIGSGGSVRNLFLAVFIIVTALGATPVSHALPEIFPAEREAFIALYNSTDGDNWKYNFGWKQEPLHTDGFAMPGSECIWWGIDCVYGGGIELSLFNNNLNGFIPPEIGNLVKLTLIQITNTQISGSIPAEIAQLQKLDSLMLADNLLSGKSKRDASKRDVKAGRQSGTSIKK